LIGRLVDVEVHPARERVIAREEARGLPGLLRLARTTRDGGCGALKELDAHHGEIKSMRTASPFLRQGVASALLDHMLRVARQRGYHRVSLETGGVNAFAPARALYARFGFGPCGPFADYIADGFSIFMTRELDA
jgi:putative acetyltransferase